VTSADDGSLVGVLALIERHGTSVLLSRNVEALASIDTRAALHAAGVLVPARPAPTWPCDVRGCSREVRANYDGARKPLVAVCSQAPAECAPVELGFDDVAQQQVSVDGLVTAVCTLLGATIDRGALAKVREPHAVGEVRAPLALGATANPAADLFWLGSPRDADLSAWCARRERAELRTIVLVPTTKNVPLEVAARFCRGEIVEVRALADVVEVRDAKLALAGPTRPALVAMTTSPPPAPSAGIAAILGVTRWEEIRLLVVDGLTLRIEANGKSMLRSFVELGFVDGRKRETVSPNTAWALLLLFCKHARIKPTAYREIGKSWAVKKAVERLGLAMRASFGLADHPIHKYSKTKHLWEARFLVAEAEKPSPR
jgi:hypothetical protein